MPLQSFPIGAISYAGGLVRALYERGPSTVEEVAASYPSELLFPQGTTDPQRRLSDYGRALRLLRLATVDDGRWQLTEVGRRYHESAEAGQAFSVSEAQAVILRDLLDEHSEEDVFQTALVALATARAAPPGLTAVEFGTLFATRGHQEHWDIGTFRAQGWRYSALLRDMRLVDDQRHLTAQGDAVLGRHPAMGEASVGAEAETHEPSRSEPRVWCIRAGVAGEYEQLALDEGVSVIGWTALGEITVDMDRDELKTLLQEATGETRAMSLASQVSSIYRFIHEVAVGDLVVLPLRRLAAHVAVGRIAGEFEQRTDPAFAGTDATNTRKTEWLASDLPYERFAADLREAFGQQGTLSEISKPNAARRILEVLHGADASAIHLIVKWSERFGANTVDEHRKIAEERGEVWWGLIGSLDRPRLASKWVDTIRAQLEGGTPTNVFISGPSCWSATLEDIADSRGDIDESLVPDYYTSDLQHNFWVKLQSFEATDRAWLIEHLELVSAPGKPLSEGALSNQTNPLIVRRVESRLQTRRVWWVNQGATYVSARDLGVLWAPKTAKDGSGRAFWRALQEARVGDRVIHYANNHIRAVSTISEEAIDALRPSELKGEWVEGDGWLVRADYHQLDEPIHLSAIPAEWVIEEHGPFTQAGSVQQGYFFPLTDRFVNQLAGRFPQLGLGAGAIDDLAPQPIAYVEPAFDEIEAAIRGLGLRVSRRNLRRYHVSLKTRGFVVLAGVSGSGKTWLAEAYADTIGAEKLRVPVAPNWTTNEDLLGYLNPIDGNYRHTDFSRFLLRAAAEFSAAQAASRQPRPFHLILDEMNLARVEYYFAKFLSAMEARARYGTAPVVLAEDLEAQLTANLKFIGTVNIDETTFGFADKIYDRAQLIELDAPWEALAEHIAGKPFQATLEKIWGAIHEIAPFGFRILDEFDSYVTESAELDVGWTEAVDDQLLQKVLPRIKGTDPRIRAALEGVLEVTEETFPLSHEKASSMLEMFNAHGFVSFF